MNREEILDKYIHGIYLPGKVREAIINAMKEIEVMAIFEKICVNCINYEGCELNGVLHTSELIAVGDEFQTDFTCYEKNYEKHKEIQELLDQINDNMSVKDLWQDNGEIQVPCIPLKDYDAGSEENEDCPLTEVKIVDIMPLWNKLYKLLSNEVD